MAISDDGYPKVPEDKQSAPDLSPEARMARLQELLKDFETMPVRNERQSALAYLCQHQQFWPAEPNT